MNALVIIPSLQHKYSFSAPLAWLFSNHASQVRGIYSGDLTPKALQGISLCIIELNWFIELCEFGHIVNFIRMFRKDCKVLFGGLFAQLKYQEIFRRFNVDYFIKGFAEAPMKLLLDGKNPAEIPNMVGRDFENETTYFPTPEELKNLTYNLDWFPDYFRNWALFPAPGADVNLASSWLPLRPTYRYPAKIKNPLKQFRVPPRGGRYHLPMVITARGCCGAIHDGCSYCMGSKVEKLQEIYRCHGAVLDNQMVKKHLRQISTDFKQATLYINTPFTYDFTGEHYDLDITIEVDCPVTSEQLRSILYAFSKATVHLVLYKEGHKFKSCNQNYADVKNLLSLEDETHRIYFFAYKDDANAVGLPSRNRLYSEFVFPKWSDWEFYNDWNKAWNYSKRWFAFTRQYNLFPPPRRIIMSVVVNTIFIFTALISKLGINTLKENMLFGETE